jgi:hypothetical protein
VFLPHQSNYFFIPLNPTPTAGQDESLLLRTHEKDYKSEPQILFECKDLVSTLGAPPALQQKFPFHLKTKRCEEMESFSYVFAELIGQVLLLWEFF